MPLVRFISPGDERLLQTLDATLQSPDQGGLVSNGLVYRYNLGETHDGLEGEEGTFNICTFWLVEALTRASRIEPERLKDARLIFEQMLGYSNHLGLYAEETGTHGEALGNFPQAFTHLARDVPVETRTFIAPSRILNTVTLPDRRERSAGD